MSRSSQSGSSDLVQCAIEDDDTVGDCQAEWDAVEAAAVTGFECPNCENGWKDFHAAVDPKPDPEDVKVDYPFEGESRVIQR